jgi:hypothetical protein
MPNYTRIGRGFTRSATARLPAVGRRGTFRPTAGLRRTTSCRSSNDELRHEMNADLCVEATKVLIWRSTRIEETAARIRHELEHARQYAVYGQKLTDLYGLCVAVVRVRVAGLPGGSLLYTTIPIELDANAAAARFVTSLYGADRILELLKEKDVDGAPLRSLVAPGAITTLPERMLSFLASHRDLSERYAEQVGLDFATLIELRWHGAGEKWTQLLSGALALPR